MKVCSKCSQSKELNQFHKKTRAKDGLQTQCKACVKESNEVFRLLNPRYQNQWYDNNSQKWNNYVLDYQRADKVPLIYGVIAPDENVYVGKTNSYLRIRKARHSNSYNLFKKGQKNRRIPLLHDSFDKYGFKNHKFVVLGEFEGIDDKQLRMHETTFIRAFKMINKSLNINDK